MILKGGIPGVIAKPGPGLGHGITPAQVATGAPASSPLLNDFDAGDTLTQLMWALLAPLVPTGTTQVNDAGRYWLLEPAQGTWLQLYRVLAMPATGAPVVDEATITTVVGDPPAQPYADQPTTSASWSYLQTATLWVLTGRDEWGGQVVHAAPVLFLCDYAEESRRMVSARGDEFVTKLLIYTSLPGVKQGDMVLIGASSEANPFAAGASEVRAVNAWADTFKAEGAPDFRIAT